MSKKFLGCIFLTVALGELWGCSDSDYASHLVLPETFKFGVSDVYSSSDYEKEKSSLSSCVLESSSSQEKKPNSSSISEQSFDSKSSSSTKIANPIQQTAVIQYAAEGATIKVNNGCVESDGGLVVISCGGTYEFSGNNENGQIQVNTFENDSVVHIRLNNLNLTNLLDAPFFVINSSRTIVKSLDKTKNSFTDASTRNKVTYTKKGKSAVKEDTTSGCMFVKGDLTLNGTGMLVINANYRNGIHASDDIRIRDNPVINVNAINNAVKGKGSVDIDGGVLTLNAKEGSGIKSDEGEDDGVVVEEKGSVFINAGKITIKSGDEGISAYNEINVSGVDSIPELYIEAKSKGLKANVINLGKAVSTTYANKDGWKAAEKININAGYHYINASSDGLDAETGITMTEGFVIVENLSVKDSSDIVYGEKYFLFKDGFFLGFGTNTKDGVKKDVFFTNKKYYGTSRGVFKPSFNSSLIVLGKEETLVEENDVSLYSSVCFPKESTNCLFLKK